ncbi:putative glycosyltransferase [Camellia lanceoleosa]|uniref:Glycosyltransferase n=1 Tax=Camellia lanceoleosa TaxID=1840588 RepID=A0ACC0H4B1_9ERIC|nr:putative glycosyltransferase [Camellia lanceoleosa]
MSSSRRRRRKERVRWIQHYNNGQKILLVGEGDFSFSACLARAFRSAVNMVATSRHSQELLRVKHWTSEAELQTLERLGCLILHEVDVYEMGYHPTLSRMKFDVVIFNFPHAGHFYGFCERDEELIEMHRELLTAFFENARDLLEEGGEVHVTHRDDYPYNTWRLEELASKTGFNLKEKVGFEKENYPGYHNKRGGDINCNKPFLLKLCFTFKFTLKKSYLPKNNVIDHNDQMVKKIDTVSGDRVKCIVKSSMPMNDVIDDHDKMVRKIDTVSGDRVECIIKSSLPMNDVVDDQDKMVRKIDNVSSEKVKCIIKSSMPINDVVDDHDKMVRKIDIFSGDKVECIVKRSMPMNDVDDDDDKIDTNLENNFPSIINFKRFGREKTSFKMWLPKKPLWAPSLSYSISVSVLLLVTPLLVFSLDGCTLCPQRSWFSFHSPWPWRVGFFSSYSLPVNEELDRPPNLEGSLVLNSSLAHTLLDEETALQSLDDKKQEGVRDKYGLRRSKKRDAKLKRVEASLAGARALIRNAMINQNRSSPLQDSDYVPNGDIYRNAYAFHRSYKSMERMFKIYVYEEGEPPIFHNGPCKDIYSMEGLFLSFMESNTHFRTHNPDLAHVYFLPFSVVMIIETLFNPIIGDKAVLKRTVGGYVRLVSSKYPYWNRSLGADHFMLSCHDWGPLATRYVPQLYFTSIRVLCNANTSEHFNPKKDASFPEINLKTGEIEGLTGGLPPSNRTVLAFFAGGAHGHIRSTFLKHWKEKDEQLLVYETLPEGMSYPDMMKKSRYCICPSGWEVASPRIVEAIYAECVPVLISQHYVLPFSDVLDWNSFSVEVSVSDIPNLKKILLGIPEDRYLRLREGVKQVQRHFLVNDPPKRYDVFHMIIHSIWLRRLNVLVYS